MAKKIQQLKELVKQIAVLQRTLKNHRKTVNFKGDARETVELYTYDYKRNPDTGHNELTGVKSKIYLTPYNAQQLLQSTWNWRPDACGENKSSDVLVYEVNIDKMGDGITGDIHFQNTSELARVLNTVYALLRYERKTKKNEQLEPLLQEVKSGKRPYLAKLMFYWRDYEEESGAGK